MSHFRWSRGLGGGHSDDRRAPDSLRHEDRESLARCRLCPNLCEVNRMGGQTGRCGAGDTVIIYRHGPHHGEEPPISGYHGSGTIFFSSCPLRCIYCQNHRWSQARPLAGKAYSVSELADVCLQLQHMRCHNINLVTPEPWIHHIMAAIVEAKARGLTLPVVYNTSGFVTEESLRLLKGTVDVYLTDIRYASPSEALEFSGVAAYFEACRTAARAMWRQVGPLVCGEDGIATRGTIVRHLLIPGLLQATSSVLRFITEELSPDCHVSLMGQFEPAHLARCHPDMMRPISSQQYAEALKVMRSMGLRRGWRQPPGPPAPGLSGTDMQPTFSRRNPA